MEQKVTDGEETENQPGTEQPQPGENHCLVLIANNC